MADTTFDKSALSWTLPFDADWVTAVSFIGDAAHWGREQPWRDPDLGPA